MIASRIQWLWLDQIIPRNTLIEHSKVILISANKFKIMYNLTEFATMGSLTKCTDPCMFYHCLHKLHPID